MQYEQDASNITAKMAVDSSEAQKNITIQQGEASSIATKLLTDADGYTKQKTITSQAEAFTIAANLTGQTASDTLMQYIYYTNLLTNNKNSTVLVGIDRAVLSVN